MKSSHILSYCLTSLFDLLRDTVVYLKKENTITVLSVVTILFCGLTFYSCQKVDLNAVDNLNGNRIGILGHGGLGFTSAENHLPSNSKASITQAVEGWQADGVDVDVKLSADSILILYHDDYLSSLTDCHGCIIQQSHNDLMKCRYRQGFNTNIAQNESIISLEKVLQRFSTRPIRPLVYLDVDINLPCTEESEKDATIRRFARQLNELLQRYQATDWTVIEVTNLTFADYLMQQNPDLRLIFAGLPNSGSVKTAIDKKFFGLVFFHLDSHKDLVKSAHDAGLQVVLWGLITAKDHRNAVKQSPDWIITDNIPLAIRVLN